MNTDITDVLSSVDVTLAMSAKSADVTPDPKPANDQGSVRSLSIRSHTKTTNKCTQRIKTTYQFVLLIT